MARLETAPTGPGEDIELPESLLEFHSDYVGLSVSVACNNGAGGSTANNVIEPVYRIEPQGKLKISDQENADYHHNSRNKSAFCISFF